MEENKVMTENAVLETTVTTEESSFCNGIVGGIIGGVLVNIAISGGKKLWKILSKSVTKKSGRYPWEMKTEEPKNEEELDDSKESEEK